MLIANFKCKFLRNGWELGAGILCGNWYCPEDSFGRVSSRPRPDMARSARLRAKYTGARTARFARAAPLVLRAPARSARHEKILSEVKGAFAKNRLHI